MDFDDYIAYIEDDDRDMARQENYYDCSPTSVAENHVKMAADEGYIDDIEDGMDIVVIVINMRTSEVMRVEVIIECEPTIEYHVTGKIL